MNDELKHEIPVETVSLDDAAEKSAAPSATDGAVDTEKLTAALAEMNDKYLRAVAELENTRRRASLDIESAARGRTVSVVENFLPVMDALDAAKLHAPDDAGIAAMARAMESAFAKIGIVRIQSVGETLNPQFHNAVQVAPATDSGDDAANTAPAPNTIVRELQPGYMFGDTVLRPAMVVVSK
jgi:molecular chaperone GrpE